MRARRPESCMLYVIPITGMCQNQKVEMLGYTVIGKPSRESVGGGREMALDGW